MAEVTEGRVQVVGLDGEGEMVDGRIFVVWEGDWKMWLDTGTGIITANPVEAPILTMPGGVVKFRYHRGEREVRGRLKRLKRADL